MKKKYLTCLAVVLASSFTLVNAQTKKSKDSLKEKEIEEVVMVGFGKQKKSDLTNSVSSISEKALEGRPVNNVVEALRGVAPGLSFNVGTGGGQLNSSSSISLRGTGTVGGFSSSAPLVLIDGMEGDPSRLNPRDVESISILKDAAASSIYGSRAAFGVIIITTKSGKKGKMQISYDLIQRFSTPLLTPKMMDSESFAHYFNEAARNSDTPFEVFDQATLDNIKRYKNGEIKTETEWDPTLNGNMGEWKKYSRSWGNNDWFKIFYRSWVPATEHNMSVRGGSDKATYYFSANYLNQDGLNSINPDKLKRYTANSKIKVELFPFLNMQYNARFIRSDYNSSAYMGGLFFHNIARRWPTLPVKDPNGYYIQGNEINELQNSFHKNQQDFLDQQLVFTFTPIKGWDTNVEFNYKIENFTTQNKYMPIYRYDLDGNPVATNYQTFANWDVNGGSNIYEYFWKTGFFNTNIYTTYNKTINQVHNFKATLGMQAELYKARNFSSERDKLISSDLSVINATIGTNDNVSGGAAHWSTFGTFGRLNYDFDRKYLIEANIRLDASSRYLRDQRWQWYPSVSLGWNVAREGFWRDSFLGNIKEFKFRASYGSLGNQNLRDNYYPFFLNQPFGVQNGGWLINGMRTNTASAPGMVSTNLTWERISTRNFGFDFSAFRNRLSAKFDYFIRDTHGMVGDAPQLPGVLGLTPPKFNNSDLETKGFEIELGWNDRIGEDFSYGIKAVVSDAQSVITKFNNPTNHLDQNYVGQRIGDIWGYTTRGIAKTQAEMDEWLRTHDQSQIATRWYAGDIMYEDLNGDGVINVGAKTLDNHGDLKVIGNTTQRYNFGINLDFQYKGFDLSMLFQGVGKRQVNLIYPDQEAYFVGANTGFWQSAAFVQHLDYFRPEGTTNPLGPNVDSYYPRVAFGSLGKNFQSQTRWLQNAAYIRLKNIQLGYSLPKDVLESLGISNLRIYVTGENLLTWTKLSKIFDPETIDGAWGNGKVYPLSKVIATGISINF